MDLRSVAGRLADRRKGRTEANVQSDLHAFLMAAPFELEEHDLNDIVLESPAGQRRRIDVETGFTVFEVKRDLRSPNVRAEAVEQLAGYVRGRTREMNQRYVGVLTDGVDWQVYHLAGDELRPVSSLTNDPASPDVEALTAWLEGVLATTERIVPTPHEIERRLGAQSSAHALDAADLAALYAAHRDLPAVKLKRELWAKLLTTALGTNFTDEDDLFVNHTLLVATAEVIAHAVVGFNPADPSIGPATLMSGALFSRAGIGGVVEADFFDWVVEVPGGDRWVRSLARRLSRFAWERVEHDVMKVLYESVIAAEQRHRLGEYYTPDWLADEIVGKCVEQPLEQRVLDPACGSGTFLFHAVRQYVDAASAAGHGNAEIIEGATRRVLGVDVHPVAVAFARATYLLALGMDRLRADDRPAFTVPVYLGDSVQWGQERTLLASDALTVPTDDGARLFAEELRFPERLLADADRFDRLVAELADKAANRVAGSAVPSLRATFRLHAVHAEDEETLERTFRTMCELHDQGRDHIWGYYVRNLARPAWLSQLPNRVDVLVGNPPWLAYRYMPEALRAEFRAMSAERSLWAGATVATHQDLSGLFVVRAIELYLREEGRFGFVMPWGVLSRRQHAGFREAIYRARAEPVTVAFDQPWDLHLVKPSFFPVPASVVFGERTAGRSVPLNGVPEVWAGRVRGRNPSSAEAMPYITRSAGAAAVDMGRGSPYAPRFAQGATVVPRMMFLVEPDPDSPLGAGAGRLAVRSRRSVGEKKPWKDIQTLHGTVERQFVLPMHYGDTLLPFRLLEPVTVVMPWDGRRLLDGRDERLDLYPGLADWWRRAEATWMAHRSSGRLTLIQQLDYRRKLSQQFPPPQHRVVYSKGGMYLAAAIVTDPGAVIDHKLYWAAAHDLAEARYLVAILNSTTLTKMIRPLQARGEHNPRDFDKYVWRAPIPLYDPDDPQHRSLVELAEEAERVALSVPLAAVSFEAQRRHVRQALEAGSVGAAIDDAVAGLLGAAGMAT